VRWCHLSSSYKYQFLKLLCDRFELVITLFQICDIDSERLIVWYKYKKKELKIFLTSQGLDKFTNVLVSSFKRFLATHTKPSHTRVSSPHFWSTHPIYEIKKDYSEGGLRYLAPIVWLDIGYLAPILGQPLVVLSVRENFFDWLLKHVHIIWRKKNFIF